MVTTKIAEWPPESKTIPSGEPLLWGRVKRSQIPIWKLEVQKAQNGRWYSYFVCWQGRGIFTRTLSSRIQSWHFWCQTSKTLQVRKDKRQVNLLLKLEACFRQFESRVKVSDFLWESIWCLLTFLVPEWRTEQCTNIVRKMSYYSSLIGKGPLADHTHPWPSSNFVETHWYPRKNANTCQFCSLVPIYQS